MLNLEEKAKIGKDVIAALVDGVAFPIVLSHIVLSCANSGEEEIKKTVDEILVLGLNEYMIEKIADTYHEHALESMSMKVNDIRGVDIYNKVANNIRKTCESNGNEDVCEMMIPLKTLTGMALCKAGEKLMRGE